MRTAAAIALVALAGGAVWLLSKRDEERPPFEVAAPYADARMVPVEGAGVVAREVGHPVFWAGPRPGMKVAVSDDANGNVHVRYLPQGVDPETEAEAYLSIGSYPFPGAYEATATLARQAGRKPLPVPGGVGFLDLGRTDAAILSFRRHPDLQVEVLHPSPDRAASVVRTGGIVTVP